MRSLIQVAIVAIAMSTPAVAGTWKIDTSHSSAGFRVKHLMITNVSGTMHGVEGTVDIDDKDPTKSKVSATVDATTIDTNEAKRDEHLKSPDFFNTAKNPKITFVSKSVKTAGAGKLAVTGALTMNGVTKDVVLDVEGPTAPIKGMAGDQRRGLTATTTLNRKDYNINWNKALDGGGVVVGEEVKVTLDLELTDDVKASH